MKCSKKRQKSGCKFRKSGDDTCKYPIKCKHQMKNNEAKEK